jgi:hypothetical protein
MINTNLAQGLTNSAGTPPGTRTNTTRTDDGGKLPDESFHASASTEGDDLGAFLRQAKFPTTVTLSPPHPNGWMGHGDPSPFDSKTELTPSLLADSLEAWQQQNPGRKMDVTDLDACLMSPTLESLPGTADASGYIFTCGVGR